MVVEACAALFCLCELPAKRFDVTVTFVELAVRLVQSCPHGFELACCSAQRLFDVRGVKRHEATLLLRKTLLAETCVLGFFGVGQTRHEKAPCFSQVLDCFCLSLARLCQLALCFLKLFLGSLALLIRRLQRCLFARDRLLQLLHLVFVFVGNHFMGKRCSLVASGGF